jgi:hypothetical protein
MAKQVVAKNSAGEQHIHGRDISQQNGRGLISETIHTAGPDCTGGAVFTECAFNCDQFGNPLDHRPMDSLSLKLNPNSGKPTCARNNNSSHIMVAITFQDSKDLLAKNTIAALSRVYMDQISDDSKKNKKNFRDGVLPPIWSTYSPEADVSNSAAPHFRGPINNMITDEFHHPFRDLLP